MQAMIVNDSQKEWMRPLLELRNKLDEDDRDKRDFRRMNGQLSLYKRDGQDALIHGPYTQQAREMWLRELLRAQKEARAVAPEEMKGVTLISLDELEEIRRIWVSEKHEIEDSLPWIFANECGEPYPGGRIDDSMALNAADIEILERVCGDRMHFQLVRELLSIERKHSTMVKRSGIYRDLEDAIRCGAFDDEEDALNYAVTRRDALNAETPAAAATLLES